MQAMPTSARTAAGLQERWGLVGPAIALLWTLPLCAQGTGGPPGEPQLRALLERHRTAVVLEQGRPLGNLRLSGTMQEGERRHAVRIFVRRHPFAVRYEVQDLAPQGTVRVAVSDGRHAWDQHGRPLSAPASREFFEEAFIDSLLYLDPANIRGGPDNQEAWPLKDHEGQLPPGLATGLRTVWIALRSPAGTLLQCHFDPADARLHEVASADLPEVQWYRYGDWQRHGGLVLPMLRASGMLGRTAVVVRRFDEVQPDPSLPDELFAGCPAQPTPALQQGGPLVVAPHTIPGAAHLLLPQLDVNGTHPALGILDTGATSCAVTPAFAQVLNLHPRSSMSVMAFGGPLEARSAWLDELVMGERRVLQFAVPVAPFGGFIQAPPDRQPGVLIGIQAMADSPVLDLEAGLLSFRGAPVAKLQAREARRLVTVPIERERGDTPWVRVQVNGVILHALLDTGSSPTLRLSRAALLRCGLPVDVAVWRGRGAGWVGATDLGMRKTRELVVQLESVELGEVRLRDPVVQLAELDGSKTPWEAVVGCGALVGFARVGLDFERNLLELELPRGVAGEGVVELAGPGVFLGFTLVSARVGAQAGALGLPLIQEVTEGLPGARAGLRDGEWLVSIDRRPCAGVAAYEANRSLWLRPGASVELQVQGKDGKRRLVQLRP